MDLSAIPIDALMSETCASTDTAHRREAVERLAREFEGVMVAALLKEGLKQAGQAGGGESEQAASPYMDMALEQIAYFVGRQGILGIADAIVTTHSQPHGETDHAIPPPPSDA